MSSCVCVCVCACACVCVCVCACVCACVHGLVHWSLVASPNPEIYDEKHVKGLTGTDKDGRREPTATANNSGAGLCNPAISIEPPTVS